MESPRLRLSRRALCAGALALVSSRARAFGAGGAFHVRFLQAGLAPPSGPRNSAGARWAWEVIRRTSAPARLTSAIVAADETTLLEEPFVVWAGATQVVPLADPEIRGLRQYLSLGGMLLVDDSDPASGEFGRSVRRELARVLPESPVIRLPERHVLFKSYYLIDRPVGRVQGPTHLEAITAGNAIRVLLSSHDLLGALAQRSAAGQWAFSVASGGARQRELAVRLAVNTAMYVLCLDYKDDQVHAEELMRRRGRRRP